MKVSKIDNRFKTGFPKPITGLPKNHINIPSPWQSLLDYSAIWLCNCRFM